MMRKLALTAAVTVTTLAAGSLLASSADAMTLGAPGGVRAAIDATNIVDNVACWRWGWHGWGWYPCGYGYYRPYAYGYYRPYRHYGYYRGYGYRGWGYRGWRRW